LPLLIAAGADVNKANNDGYTPLSCALLSRRSALQEGHRAIVEMLREAGAKE
jgi:ankyrin repeat protein